MISTSTQAEALLKAAGWTSSRSVDIVKYQDVLTPKGYPIFSAWKHAMMQFGDLRMSYPVPRKPSLTTRVHFDPIGAANGISWRVVEWYAQRVGEPLAVIGEADNEHLTLLIGPSGKIYGGYDEFLCELGTGVVDVLDGLLTHREVKEIPE